MAMIYSKNWRNVKELQESASPFVSLQGACVSFLEICVNWFFTLFTYVYINNNGVSIDCLCRRRTRGHCIIRTDPNLHQVQENSGHDTINIPLYRRQRAKKTSEPFTISVRTILAETWTSSYCKLVLWRSFYLVNQISFNGMYFEINGPESLNMKFLVSSRTNTYLFYL
jgi:hypothetical protein